MCVIGGGVGDPAVTLARLLDPAADFNTVTGKAHLSAVRLRRVIKDQWPEVAAAAHAIHDEKEPADALDVAGYVFNFSGGDGVKLVREHWPQIEKALTAAGFKVVRI